MGKDLDRVRLRNHQKPDDDQVTCRERRFKSINDLFLLQFQMYFIRFTVERQVSRTL